MHGLSSQDQNPPPDCRGVVVTNKVRLLKKTSSQLGCAWGDDYELGAREGL